MAWSFKLLCGDESLSLMSAWRIVEGGASLSLPKTTLYFAGGSAEGGQLTGAWADNRVLSLVCDVATSGMANLSRDVGEAFRFFNKARQHYLHGARDKLWLKVAPDEGYATSGEKDVLFGRGPLYAEVFAADPDFTPLTLEMARAGYETLTDVTLNLTCAPHFVGRPTFFAEATGWYRYDADNNLSLWRACTNLMHNPGFEHATYDTDWAQSNGELTDTQEYERVHGGFSACRLNNNGASDRQWRVTLTLAAQVYAISCYAYTDGTAVTTADLDLWGQGAEVTTTFTADPDRTGWYRLTGYFNGQAASSTHGVQVHAGKTVVVDDFQLEVFDASLLSVTNLLSNPGFESAGAGDPDFFANWTEAADDGVIFDEGTLVHGGSHACGFTAGAATQITSVSQAVAVTAGQKYILWYYTRGQAGGSTTAGRVRVYDVTNAADILAATSSGVTAAAYTLCSYTFTAPAGCTSVSIWLYCNTTNTEEVYFDDVTLGVLPASSIAWCSPVAIGDQGPGLEWVTVATPHDSSTTRTGGQWRMRSYWSPHPGYETLFAGKGALDVWVKTPWAGDDGIAHYLVASQVASTTERILLYKSSGNVLTFQIWGSTASGYKTLSFAVDATSWPADAWQHVVAQWDGYAPTGLYLYGGTDLSDLTVTTTGTWTNPDSFGTYWYAGSDTSGVSQADALGLHVRVFGPDAAVTVASLHAAGRGKGEMAALWTASIGGQLEDTEDSTPYENYWWLSGVPGDVPSPLRILLDNPAAANTQDVAYIGLKPVSLPHRLNVYEGVIGAECVSTVDAARSGGAYLRVSPAATTEPAATNATYGVITDSRLAPFVRGRYKIVAAVQDGAAATGVFKVKAKIEQPSTLTLASGDYVSADVVGGWTLLDLGTFDLSVLPTVSAFVGQRIETTLTPLDFCQVELYVWMTSGAGLNFNIDYIILFPADECGRMEDSLANNDLLATRVFVHDAIDGQRAFLSAEVSSIVQMQAYWRTEWIGQWLKATPQTWNFGNCIYKRASGGPVPADAVNIFAIYQPRYLWSR